MKTYIKVSAVLVLSLAIVFSPAIAFAKGGGGGGRASSSARSSTSSRSSSSSSSSKSSSSSSSKSSTSTKSPSSKGTSTAKPGSKVTVNGKTVTSSTKTPTNKKYSSASGVVGDNGYAPKFTSGYTAPAGSVVYYPQHSFIDYLPWIYLFSQDSPANDKVTVVEPDGKEVEAQPQAEGDDGMVVLNWILLILMGGGVLILIVWGVNKLTDR